MKYLIILVLLTICTALAGVPVISGLTSAQRVDASMLVDIYYSVANDFPMTITLLVSNDNGATWTFSCAQVTGDVGAGISPGTGKHIIWDVATEHPNISGTQFKFKIIADDGIIPPIPENFALVEGGTFNNGSSNVTLSSFYIDKYEVTQSEYQAVMGNNPSLYAGYPTRPVEQVTWFNAIEYCNKRSVIEGLAPCYTYSGYGTNPDAWPDGWDLFLPYIWPNSYHLNISCDWDLDGYRLPSEMQWMFAARGGILTHGYTYSGGNNIQTVAWYYSNSSNATHTVGTKASNELGIFDMSGNVWEWTWDIWGAYPTTPQTNPTGPASGPNRLRRGGNYGSDASGCTVIWRMFIYPYDTNSYFGFRVSRKA